VYACLGRFYNQIKGGREMVAMAKGVLVIPSVVKGGFIVGGEYGEGALRAGGKTVSNGNKGVRNKGGRPTQLTI
jgi:lipid-binding SYLF domain-containing protein